MRFLDRYSYELFCERLNRQGVSKKVEYLDNFHNLITKSTVKRCLFIAFVTILFSVFFPALIQISLLGGLFYIFFTAHMGLISQKWTKRLKREKFYE